MSSGVNMKDEYLVRSQENPGAVLNTDTAGLLQYKRAKNRYASLENDINNLKNELKLIKEMLQNAN